jgi:hypothetical protein
MRTGISVDVTDLCHRQGAYRLARLAARFGPEISLPELLDRLALDCPYRRGPGERRAGKYEPKCHARLPDIDTPTPRPPNRAAWEDCL